MEGTGAYPGDQNNAVAETAPPTAAEGTTEETTSLASSSTPSYPFQASESIFTMDGWPLLIGVPSVVCIILVICGFYTLLKKRSQPNAPYSAAVHNQDFFEDKDNLRCLNCHLIEMGSMACYQGVCPQCGRPPPGAA